MTFAMKFCIICVVIGFNDFYGILLFFFFFMDDCLALKISLLAMNSTRIPISKLFNDCIESQLYSTRI